MYLRHFHHRCICQNLLDDVIMLYVISFQATKHDD